MRSQCGEITDQRNLERLLWLLAVEADNGIGVVTSNCRSEGARPKMDAKSHLVSTMSAYSRD